MADPVDVDSVGKAMSRLIEESRLTREEYEIIETLGDIYNRISALPREHPDEFDDLSRHIHALQRDVMARPTRRSLHG